jgi:hypothetical protein
MSRWVLLFLTGSILGSLGDYFHKLFGVTIYPTQISSYQIPGIPVWTIFLFGFGAVAMGLGLKLFWKFRKHLKFRVRSSNLHSLLAGITFLGIYALSALIGNCQGHLPDVALAATSLLFWELSDGTSGGLLFAISVGFVGTSVEILLVHFGFFFYGNQVTKLMGVASWLPWIYVSAAIAAANFSGTLNFREQRQKARARFKRSKKIRIHL